MAKPIEADPILRGKVARDFEKKFVLNTKPDPDKVKRNEQDLAFYRANKAFR